MKMFSLEEGVLGGDADGGLSREIDRGSICIGWRKLDTRYIGGRRFRQGVTRECVEKLGEKVWKETIREMSVRGFREDNSGKMISREMVWMGVSERWILRLGLHVSLAHHLGDLENLVSTSGRSHMICVDTRLKLFACDNRQYGFAPSWFQCWSRLSAEESSPSDKMPCSCRGIWRNQNCRVLCEARII